MPSSVCAPLKLEERSTELYPHDEFAWFSDLSNYGKRVAADRVEVTFGIQEGVWNTLDIVGGWDHGHVYRTVSIRMAKGNRVAPCRDHGRGDIDLGQKLARGDVDDSATQKYLPELYRIPILIAAISEEAVSGCLRNVGPPSGESHVSLPAAGGRRGPEPLRIVVEHLLLPWGVAEVWGMGTSAISAFCFLFCNEQLALSCKPTRKAGTPYLRMPCWDTRFTFVGGDQLLPGRLRALVGWMICLTTCGVGGVTLLLNVLIEVGRCVRRVSGPALGLVDRGDFTMAFVMKWVDTSSLNEVTPELVEMGETSTAARRVTPITCLSRATARVIGALLAPAADAFLSVVAVCVRCSALGRSAAAAVPGPVVTAGLDVSGSGLFSSLVVLRWSWLVIRCSSVLAPLAGGRIFISGFGDALRGGWILLNFGLLPVLKSAVVRSHFALRFRMMGLTSGHLRAAATVLRALIWGWLGPDSNTKCWPGSVGEHLGLWDTPQLYRTVSVVHTAGIECQEWRGTAFRLVLHDLGFWDGRGRSLPCTSLFSWWMRCTPRVDGGSNAPSFWFDEVVLGGSSFGEFAVQGLATSAGDEVRSTSNRVLARL
nr:hypothetical protein Iba_chr01aCG6730 [Ipomoea batatas]